MNERGRIAPAQTRAQDKDRRVFVKPGRGAGGREFGGSGQNFGALNPFNHPNKKLNDWLRHALRVLDCLFCNG
jgi:hypothetical protein